MLILSFQQPLWSFPLLFILYIHRLLPAEQDVPQKQHLTRNSPKELVMQWKEEMVGYTKPRCRNYIYVRKLVKLLSLNGFSSLMWWLMTISTTADQNWPNIKHYKCLLNLKKNRLSLSQHHLHGKVRNGYDVFLSFFLSFLPKLMLQ